MGLHIEISGSLTTTELDAVAALIAVLRGNAQVPALPATQAMPSGMTVEQARAALPTVTAVAAPVPPVPTPPVPIADAPVASEPLPPMPAGGANPAAAQLAEMLIEKISQPGGVELDSSGLPWDIRIHASTKTKKADGSWTQKRGSDKAMVAAVEAELRQVMSAAVPGAIPAPPLPDAPPPPAQTDPAAAFGGNVAAPAPPTHAVPAPPTSNAPVAPSSAEVPAPVTTTPHAEFQRIMKIVIAKQAAGTLNTEMTTQIAQQIGLTSIRDLANRPDMIPMFEAMLPA